MQKTRKYSLFLILLILVISFMISFQTHARPTILCPLSENQVTIDGKWTTPHEWTDSLREQFTFASGSGEAYFHLKHDTTALYLLLDYVTLEAPHSRDAAGVLVDTQNDGGTIMQEDDYFLTQIYLGTETAWLVRGWGTGSKIMNDFSDLDWELIMSVDWELNPNGFQAESSTDINNNPYSQNTHVIWEFKIPKSEFQSNTISFITYLINYNGENGASYPLIDLSKLDSPQNWAELTFSNKTWFELTNPLSTSPTTTTQTTSISTSQTSITPTQIKTSSITSSTLTNEYKEIVITKENQSSPLRARYLEIILMIIIIVLILAIILTLFLHKKRVYSHQKEDVTSFNRKSK